MLHRPSVKWLIILPTQKAYNKMMYNYGHELIELDENNSILVCDSLPSKELLECQGKSYTDYIKEYPSTQSKVYSNVAIAAAITSYTRIHMQKFKTNPKNPCFYSDTDSVFLQYPLSPEEIGLELGQMKDELNDKLILEAIFLNKKMYAYKTETHSKVVIAGIPTKIIPKHTVNVNGEERLVKSFKTSVISYDKLKAFRDGEEIFVRRDNIISKSLSSLSLKQISNTIDIKFDPYKTPKLPVFNKEGTLIYYNPPKVIKPPKLTIKEQLLYKIINSYLKFKNNLKKLEVYLLNK